MDSRDVMANKEFHQHFYAIESEETNFWPPIGMQTPRLDIRFGGMWETRVKRLIFLHSQGSSL